MLWKDLFPTRAEYEARGGGFKTPPAGEYPPAGTQVTMKGKTYESTGRGMWHVIPTQRCPACGQLIQQAQQSNVGSQLRKLL